ncbi:MAG: NUDIX domain-containing protein, partial [Catenulispora sp.]|nr:NUDIX domain-containing protein [Catenulispora sp.]
AGVRTVLDADGPALAAGIEAGPDVVKPNVDELGDDTPRELLKRGARAVVATKGEEGMEVVTEQGTWRAYPPERVYGNATGAGDAAVAALARGLVRDAPWSELVTDAIALSAAAVAAPVAGQFDETAYARFRDGVHVEEMAHRAAVRVVCLDSEGRILLMHWRDPATGDSLWEPPGGGIEGGEEPIDTARRELREETGLNPAMIGEMSVAVHRDTQWNGRRWVGVEPFFLARFPSARPPVTPAELTADEQRNLVESRWVHWSELGDLAGRLEPPQLLYVVRRLAPNDLRPHLDE